MIAKLLTEHNLKFLSLKGGCRGSVRVYTCQNVKLLEISCHGSIMTAADDKPLISFLCFAEISLDIACESSAGI